MVQRLLVLTTSTLAGVPFRETHHISGAAVKMAEDRDVTLFDLSVEDLKSIHPLFEDDVLKVPICRSSSLQLYQKAWMLTTYLNALSSRAHE